MNQKVVSQPARGPEGYPGVQSRVQFVAKPHVSGVLSRLHGSVNTPHAVLHERRGCAGARSPESRYEVRG